MRYCQHSSPALISTITSQAEDNNDQGLVEGAEGGAAAAAEAAPLARTASEMERKLLEFECELDATMLRLRKNLMVIRLLGLMSEDEELQGGDSKKDNWLLFWPLA